MVNRNSVAIIALFIVALSRSGPAPLGPLAAQAAENNIGISFLDRKIAELSETIIKTPIMGHSMNLAVIPFSDLDGGTSDFGKYLSEGLIVHFTRVRIYYVVERELLNKIMEEHKLNMLGLIDPVTAKKIGKLLGVECLVTGTYSAVTGRVKVNARVISTETGMIMAAAEANISRTSDVDVLLGRNVRAGAGSRPGNSSPAEQTRQQAPAAVQPAPSYPEARAAAPGGDDVSGDTVTVPLRPDRFSPVEFKVPPSHRGCSIPLSDARPREIFTEPGYSGGVRKYGTMRLGVNGNNTFYFALDDIGGSRPVMYFDRNQNGDLTDDGGPIFNQGSGGSALFAAGVTLPFSRINSGVNYQQYKAWLFLNEMHYQKNGNMCHYSVTQFKGELHINGEDYPAFIADSDVNDADYTNDGLRIDLNRDGKIDENEESFDPGGAFRIGNRDYYFRVAWNRPGQ